MQSGIFDGTRRVFTLVAVVVVLQSILIGTCTAQTSAPVCDCNTASNIAVLQDFYLSTEGPTKWSRKWDFLSQSVCQLYGITCSLSSVTAIYLMQNSLGGTLPASLGSLDTLQTLSIMYNYNGLAGSLPPSYGGLRNLQEFTIQGSQLSGTIPVAFGNLLSLRTFSLQYCSLSGTFPSAVVRMTQLRSLSLASNSFVGTVPTSIASLSGLLSLDLSYNSFTSPIPSSISSLSALSTLNLANNQYMNLDNDTLPLSFGSLRQLRTLRLYYCNFTSGTLPPALCNLVNLTSLDVSYSQLRGTFPQCLSTFSSLQAITASGSSFNTSIPEFLYSLESLATLTCMNCLLLGPLNMTKFSTMASIRSLILDFNEFGGSLDESLALATQLATLALSWCSLIGTIPDAVGQLTSLSSLGLSGNSFQGTIPSTIGNCTSLAYLYINNNQLTGSIPVTLGSLRRLVYCSLISNKLSSSIPNSVTNLTSLQGLQLDGNQLTGLLPRIEGLRQLQQLSLSQNNFSGGLPQAWYKSSLRYLTLDTCSLTGVLPPVWGAKSDWSQVIFNGNNFVGLLPPFWSQIAGLQYLSLQNNSLSGPLPPQWGRGMKALTTLQLNANPLLCGGVPFSWVNRTSRLPSDSVNTANCSGSMIVRYVATAPPSRATRPVTVEYCSMLCNTTVNGMFPATPQTDDELAAMTSSVQAASSMANYFLLGGGVGSSDPSTLRWLVGSLGDTDNGEGTIFYTEAKATPFCVMPCAMNLSKGPLLKGVTAGSQLLVSSRDGSWLLAAPSDFLGQVGCLCQSGLPSAIQRFGVFSSSASPTRSASVTFTITSTMSVSPSTSFVFTHPSLSLANLSVTVTDTIVMPPTLTLSMSPEQTSTVDLTLTGTQSVSGFLSVSRSLPTLSNSKGTLASQRPLSVSATDKVSLVRFNVTPTQALAITGSRSLIPVAPVVLALEKAAEGMASAAAVLTAPLAVIGSSAGAADAALLAVVIGLSCGSESNRDGEKSMGLLRYTLSPFFDLGYFWMVVGNILIVGVMWSGIQCASLVVNGATLFRRVRHPSLVIRVGMFLSVGVLFGSFRLFSATSGSGVALSSDVLTVCGTLGVLLTFALNAYALLLFARTVKPAAREIDLEDVNSRLMPSTKWEPSDLVATHGSLFTSYRSPLSIRLFASMLLLPFAFTAVASSNFPDEACLAQLLIMISLEATLLFVVLWRRQYRTPLAVPLRALSSGSLLALLITDVYALVRGAGRSSGVQSVRSVFVLISSIAAILQLVYMVTCRIHSWRGKRTKARLIEENRSVIFDVPHKKSYRNVTALSEPLASLHDESSCHIDNDNGDILAMLGEIDHLQPHRCSAAEATEKISTIVCNVQSDQRKVAVTHLVSRICHVVQVQRSVKEALTIDEIRD